MDLMPPQPQRIALLLCVHRVTTPPAPAESADGAAEDEFTTTIAKMGTYSLLSL